MIGDAERFHKVNSAYYVLNLLGRIILEKCKKMYVSSWIQVGYKNLEVSKHVEIKILRKKY